MKIKKWKEFNIINEESEGGPLINWPDGISEDDIDRYEHNLMNMLASNEYEEKMSILDEILAGILLDYPDLYDDMEDDIKQLTMY